MFTISKFDTEEITKVKDALSSVCEENNLSLNPCDFNLSSRFCLLKKDSDVILHFPTLMPSPKFILSMSKRLPCKIVTLGQSSNTGAYQFSVVKKGKLLKIISLFDELVEKKNVALLNIYKEAVDKKLITPWPKDIKSEEELYYGAETSLAAVYKIPHSFDIKDEEGECFELPKDFSKVFPTFGYSTEHIKWDELAE